MSSDISSAARERCPLCDEPLGGALDSCNKCDWVRGYREQIRERGARNPRDIIATALSIVPGAGHFYKGYRLAGVLLLLAGVPIVGLFAFAFTMFVFGWSLVPVYWVAVAGDAYFRKDLRALGPEAAPLGGH